MAAVAILPENRRRFYVRRSGVRRSAQPTKDRQRGQVEPSSLQPCGPEVVRQEVDTPYGNEWSGRYGTGVGGGAAGRRCMWEHCTFEPWLTSSRRPSLGARLESGGQRDSTAKRLISERTCTQGKGAFVGQDGILRPIGNRPSDAFGRRVANPPQDPILPHRASAIPLLCTPAQLVAQRSTLRVADKKVGVDCYASQA